RSRGPTLGPGPAHARRHREDRRPLARLGGGAHRGHQTLYQGRAQTTPTSLPEARAAHERGGRPMTAELLHGRKLVFATVGVMLALLLAALDQTIVGTAMPRIVAQLQGLDYYAWVTTAYLVTSTVTIPIAGKLGDLFGRKPFLLAGMIGFVLAFALCVAVPDMMMVVLFSGINGF